MGIGKVLAFSVASAILIESEDKFRFDTSSG